METEKELSCQPNPLKTDGLTCGIYAILNTITGRVYIGSSRNIRARWHIHRRMLETGTHDNCHLQRSWDKHKDQNFAWLILEYVEDDPKLLEEREQFYLDSTLDLFNISLNVGRPSLDEGTREKLRIALLERYKDPSERKRLGKKSWSPELRQRLRGMFLGRTFSEESIQKMSNAHKGVPWSDKRRAAQAARKK